MNMHRDSATLPEWLAAMQESWGAVPAGDLLEQSSQVWESLKLSAPDKAEAASFAMVGRALKYGQSMGVALPVLSGDGTTRLMVYLHRLRLDALQGGIRSPWLNPGNVEQHPDIVFISRPRAGFQELSRVAALHARILRPGSLKAHKGGHTSETLVVDGASDLMELTDLIGKESRPFVLVLDGTRGGNEGIWAVDSALEECFPETPRIVLLSLGDSDSLTKMRQNRTRTHLWVMRLDDKAALYPEASSTATLQLGVISDDAANSGLESLAAHFFQLRRELEKSRDPILKERLAIIGKVFRALNELIVPLPRLEDALQVATRPGLFPIRCLERWLVIAGQGSCQYGDTEMGSRSLITQMSEFHSLLMQGVSGKAGWLREHLRICRINGVQTLILCGSPHEITALESWLDDTLDPGWSETIHITAMDGVRSYRQQRDMMDEVIITGMLWPSRQHWLATPCKKMTFPVYAYEVTQVQRLLQRWWQENGAASRPDGDKLRHWRLNWGANRCEDKETRTQPLTLQIMNCLDHSQYPPRKQHATVPIKMELDNWLDLLLEEPAEPNRSVDSGESLSPDLVWITTTINDLPLPWGKTRPVLVLKNEDIHPTLPEYLDEGDQIILLKQTEERLATQEKLFEIVAETEGMQQFIRAANRWKSLVNVVSARFRPHQVQPHLKKENVIIGDAAIANWYRHKVYGPRDRAAVLVFARLAGIKEPEKAAGYIANGIEQLRNMHQHVGQQLRKALLERSKGATTITIGKLTMDGCTFDDMIEIAIVESVRLPTTQLVAAAKEEGLTEIAESIMAQHPKRIHFTVPALKSMRDSVYRDVDKFRACLSLMATELYEHYRDRKGRLHDVLENFRRESIEFQPKMSSVTMGQYADNRKYKGRSADINRHFCLGNARDPIRTLRIHFDWDDEDKLLVIHHAGKHLETTQS